MHKTGLTTLMWIFQTDLIQIKEERRLIVTDLHVRVKTQTTTSCWFKQTVPHLKIFVKFGSNTSICFALFTWTAANTWKEPLIVLLILTARRGAHRTAALTAKCEPKPRLRGINVSLCRLLQRRLNADEPSNSRTTNDHGREVSKTTQSKWFLIQPYGKKSESYKDE